MLPKSEIYKNLPAHPDREKFCRSVSSFLFFHINNKPVTTAALNRDFLLATFQNFGIDFQMSRTIVIQKIVK